MPNWTLIGSLLLGRAINNAIEHPDDPEFLKNNWDKICTKCGRVYVRTRDRCPDCGNYVFDRKNNTIDLTKVEGIANKTQGETWTCKKCKEENPLTASSCRGCGEYK